MMSADPTARGFVRTIAKNLKQCDPGPLAVTCERLERAADAHDVELPRRLRECDGHLRGIEIHLRSIIELVESNSRASMPGIEKARFARIVAEQRADFTARCARELWALRGAGNGTAAAADAFRTRQKSVRELFERLTGLFAW